MSDPTNWRALAVVLHRMPRMPKINANRCWAANPTHKTLVCTRRKGHGLRHHATAGRYLRAVWR